MSSMAMTAVVLLSWRSPAARAGSCCWSRSSGFFLFAIRAVLQAWLLDATPPQLGGTSIGIMFGAQAMGAAIGPISGGVLADHFGIIAAFYFLAATIVVANLMIFFTPSGVVKNP